MATLAEKAQELTKTTRVIVSFGAREGGFELTAQLRLDIMDRYGKRKIIRDPAGKFLGVQSDDAFCYLDAVTLAQAEGTSYDKLTLDNKIAADAKRKVGVDLYKMANPFWDTYYPAAVANAAVMIFQVTNVWLDSPFCLEEFGWFIVNAVKNLDSGKPSACVFVVFQESENAFAELLNKLRMGLKLSNARSTLPGEKYLRMMDALGAVQVSYADMARGGDARARATVLQANVDRVLNMIQSRIVPVPFEYEAFSATDYYDAQERQISQLGSAAPAGAAYTHKFNFRYGITQEFERELFRILDADLAKAGVYPVQV
jgi:hypothetical protein